MKKYNIVNNTLGWLCFVIAAVTYLLTIEPTASFWDCPEFIVQGAKLEVGHPPGNPIFMLTARFFVTITGNDITQASIAVNAMSALLSAATILLLFWTITHLVRKIIVRDDAQTISLPKMITIMGSGLCGALAYTWSDTFWFSAVEGEVYAFSSFCTALVFWLILKWENRAEQPHSDRYLVLIAYVIGVSVAVHLLNLLCIPAIVLIFYYRKYKNINAKGSLIALGISFVIVALILFGLVPGFVKVAQGFELFFVNVCHLGYNSGVLIYAILLVAVFVYTIYLLYNKPAGALLRTFLLLTLMLSGLTFFTDSALVWLLLIVAAAIWLYGFCNPLPRRIFAVGVLSIFVIFIGYSSYALLLIRASADTPMNQNAPDNVFTLSSYLNREQYGKTPLLYGQVFAEQLAAQTVDVGDTQIDIVKIDSRTGLPSLKPADIYQLDENGNVVDNGSKSYTKAAKTDPSEPDRYVKEAYTPDYEVASDAKMLFSRMYSTDPLHIRGYKSWSLYENKDLASLPLRVPQSKLKEWQQQEFAPMFEIAPYMENLQPINRIKGSMTPDVYAWKPSFIDNLAYFFNYQLNHMYWRYFMWNFAGRQNDIQGNGEPHLGNWISGIPFIDNARLGDQSLVPEDFTTGNKGHNVFYMLPLLMGILGLVWQALMHHPANPQRGIEQFWVVFFLFFMTGIAIVLYLNQPPSQPRERDYAFAGSFYAFAIWLGMGVAAISIMLSKLIKGGGKKAKINEKGESVETADAAPYIHIVPAIVALAIGVAVPLQMVSQTWDDHDRSHRYTTRDFGENYLNSLDPNAIIFTNGDNDTFPLWYAQEVEGVRTDVRVVNLSYLATDWYANQLVNPYYDAAPVKMTAKPEDWAYDRLQYSMSRGPQKLVPAIEGLEAFYKSKPMEAGIGQLKVLDNSNMYAPVDRNAAIKAFGINPESADSVTMLKYLDDIRMDGLGTSGFSLSKLLSFDIVANSVADGFKRPVYFAVTVPDSYYLGLDPYLSNTGLAYQVTPFSGWEVSPLADKAYENIVSRFRWGGLDDTRYNKGLYLDETVRRMVSTMRSMLLETADNLLTQGALPASDFAREWSRKNGKAVPATRYDMARQLLNLMEEKLPYDAMAYDAMSDMALVSSYLRLYADTGNAADLKRAEQLIERGLNRYAQYSRYALALGDRIGALGDTERIARGQFFQFAMYRDLINLYKALAADPEKNAEALKQFSSFFTTSPLMRVYIGPMIYLDGAGADTFAKYVNSSPEFQLGIDLAQTYAAAGIDPVKSMETLTRKYGFTTKELQYLTSWTSY